jgi:UDP-glucose 4-epimerase
MNILITGGAGYIGSAVTDLCLDAGHNVIVYDNLIMGHKEAVHPDAELVIGDIANFNLLTETLKGINVVVHMAGYANARESMSDPGKYFRINTCKPLELLEAMLVADVDQIVFSSSCAIYGDPVSELISEDHPKKPINAYGHSKLLFEQMLDWYHSIHGIKHAALRYFNAGGATADKGEDHTPEGHIIPLVLQAALGQRSHVEIFGTDCPTADGTCVRDFIHIEDLASAHLLAIEQMDGKCIHYNLGNSVGYSIREVIDTACRITGKNIKVRESMRHPGDPPTLIASSQRIIDDLGWYRQKPELEEIIGSAWEWHSRNPYGYGKQI